ncbi:SGNH/GDSL hydrolase family protein [Curtobacterium oceanosedimentum]|uniref:SGNH/GDSL hydrolase family protein n=1 Tax=Curtobacterium oceanosedimentum TaxID=465820 RepID=UPI001CE1155D|nr:SGNH/GDSL hydrolase family protein [Curtobacterium oceanosedimentum]MCA5922786.1 SGNH/GDSL hydrolase family protein [Curtobacterium oceanosedimentum]
MGSFISWFERSYKAIIIVLVAIMAVTLVILALQQVNASKPAAGSVPGPIPTFASDDEEVVGFAVVGDSVTAANSPSLDTGVAGDGSWAFYADGDGADLVGGWAEGGATTEAMDTNVKKYDADVLVVLAGTNDTGLAVPFDETAANLQRIVKKAGISKVIVSSIPPRDSDIDLPVDYNDQLRNLATDKGWIFVDAAAALRSDDRYKDGYTADGIHPAPRGAKALGEALHDAIVEAR